MSTQPRDTQGRFTRQNKSVSTLTPEHQELLARRSALVKMQRTPEEEAELQALTARIEAEVPSQISEEAQALIDRLEEATQSRQNKEPQPMNKVEAAMSTPEGRAIMKSFVDAMDRIPETTEKIMQPRPGSIHPCLPGESLEDAMHRVMTEQKPADDYDEETEAAAEAANSCAFNKAMGLLSSILLSGVIILTVMSSNAVQGLFWRKQGHPDKAALPAAFITSPALAVDPQIQLAAPETPHVVFILLEPSFAGWQTLGEVDGKPLLLKKR